MIAPSSSKQNRALSHRKSLTMKRKTFFASQKSEKDILCSRCFTKRERGKTSCYLKKMLLSFPKNSIINLLFSTAFCPESKLFTLTISPNLLKTRWRDYFKNLGDFIVLDPLFWFENRNIGGGCPPIETKDGWLIIYHAVEDTPFGKIYHASAALLDLKNPLKVLGRLKKPLFSPKASWEKSGVTNNIVFPTGAVVRDKRLYIYYGAADKLIAARSVD